ncbi:MAG TPA: hypothetical protein VLA03_07860, partial [Draconibacterium sp.]|nr:hypothetical protein [Draconibacterium sp.]
MRTKPFLSNLIYKDFTLFISLFLMAGSLFSQVKISEESWVLHTYPVEPPDKNPMFFKGESYQ